MTPGTDTFGTTQRGETVHRTVIADGPLSAAILTYGCTLQDVRLAQLPHSLTIGSPDITAYEGPLTFCSAIVGPVANRIAGAEAQIEGKSYRFDANEHDQHTLHGGRHGTHALIWQITDTGPSHCEMTLDLPDGWQGFPGNRKLTARYEAQSSTLRLTLTAQTDAPTMMNLANHSYWRMDDTGTTQGQALQIAADHYLPTDPGLIPTGEIAPVKSTRFDFRKGRLLQGGAEGLIDHNFCLSQTPMPLREIATLTGTNASMTLATTAPGLQVYDGHSLNHPDVTGNDGAPYRAYAGLALEPQFWPDAPHNPDFPDITLQPGESWQQTTTWTFTT